MRRIGLLIAAGLLVAVPLASDRAFAQFQQTENRGTLKERLDSPSGRLTLWKKGRPAASLILRGEAGTVLEVTSASSLNRTYTEGMQQTRISGKVTMRLLDGKETLLQMNADEIVLDPISPR